MCCIKRQLSLPIRDNNLAFIANNQANINSDSVY